MKLKDFFTREEFNIIIKFLSSWIYEKDYTAEEFDKFDEKLEDLAISLLMKEDTNGYFIDNMIYKFRNNPLYEDESYWK